MKIIRGSLAAVFLLLIYCSTYANVPGTDKWTRIRSENFTLIGDASEKDIRRTAVRLERFRQVFAASFPDFHFVSPNPTTVIVFASEASLGNYKRTEGVERIANSTGGFFQNGNDVNYIVTSSDSAKSDAFRNIFHQYAHYLIDNNPGKSRIPLWLYEGIAQYFEDFQVLEDGRTTYGNIRKEYFDGFKDDKLIPFETFFNIAFYTIHQQESESDGLFYAQARLLIHYLLSRHPAEFRQFLTLIGSGVAQRESFFKAFQKGYSDFESELRTYADQKTFQVSTAGPGETSPATGAADLLTTPERDIYLGDLLYHLNRFDDAERYLKHVLDTDPNSPPALSILGVIRAKQFKYEEAQILAERAVKADDSDYLILFRYAFALSRQGMTDFGFISGYNYALADKMRAALRKSIELNGDFGESRSLFALVSYVRNDELDDAQTFLSKALQMAPGNQGYLMRSAELNLRKEGFFEARQTALDVREHASEPGLRLYAQNTINLIDSTEAQLLTIKQNKGKYIDDDRVTEVPMTDEEVARRRARAEIDSIRSGLRKPDPGQRRIAGMLINVDCQPKQINFLVKTDNETVKLQAASLEGIDLITYNQNMFGAQIGCGTIRKENNAVIIYEIPGTATPGLLGKIVSIEFVPKEFKLTKNDL